MSAGANDPTRWLVTGSTGLLGRYLLGALGTKADVLATSRGQSHRPVYGRWIPVDLSIRGAGSKLVIAERPHFVIHAAAVASHELAASDPLLAHKINVAATEDIARACQAVGARMVYVSTDAVFDGRKGNYCEVDEPSPFSVYGETKLSGERATQEENPDSIVVRTNFFGWSESGNRSILEFFVNSLSAGVVVKGYTDFRVSSLYGQVLAKLIVELAQVDLHGPIHVASDEVFSKLEFGQAVAQAFGLPRSLVIPAETALGPHQSRGNRDLSLDVGLLKKTLDIKLPSLKTQLMAAACEDFRRR